ncbi:15-hydroxyprostaglandin dehydrogenase [NAD(+)]-like [Periplaneta americana]|uniref:15-hydroxyprostaglandin dehydrogenase [NAD(+)]-like n=1 Tax=Periplaneta americana TaxID=6978 RepID=UPI0037E76073
MDPKGKVALVTGGAIGIGFSTCKELLKNGVKVVVVCDVDSQKGEAAVKEMRSQYGEGRVVFMKTDVSDAKSLEEAFKKTITTHNGLDIVVNNAGIINEKEWEKSIAVNLNGVIRGTLLALEHMGKDKGGKGGIVVNMSSVCGIHPIPCTPMYNATKHGVLAFTRTIGGEYHYDITGVRVTALCPGATYTAQFAGSIKNLYDDKWADRWIKNFESAGKQEPEDVGCAVIELMQRAESGTAWMIEGGSPIYEVKLEVKEIR